jgi:hypothetical protein
LLSWSSRSSSSVSYFAVLPLLGFLLFVFVALPRCFRAMFPLFFGLPPREQTRFGAGLQASQVVVAFAESPLAFFGFPCDGPTFACVRSLPFARFLRFSLRLFSSEPGVFVLTELDKQARGTGGIGARASEVVALDGRGESNESDHDRSGERNTTGRDVPPDSARVLLWASAWRADRGKGRSPHRLLLERSSSEAT